MHKSISMIRKGLLYFSALVLVAGYPLSAMAETQEPVTEPAPVVTPESPTVTSTETVPVEPVPEPEKPKLTYSYNPATNTWDSEKWQYNPQTGAYEAPPKPIVITPEVSDDAKASLDKDGKTDVTIDNLINSIAASGNASVIGNTAGGNATSGDAAAVVNLMNVVNSSITTGNNQKIATFTQDILGDVKGDIILYPMLLKAMLEAQAGEYSNSSINAETNFDMNNDVNVSANSGDASVKNNTTGGNATSGSAHAVANVVNILNSMIAAQDSFIGTINIYGNLEGDILVAPDFIPQMLANNGGSYGKNIEVSQENTTEIVNNISAVADSGVASVFGNTSAGNATSGDAKSNVVLFNVSGHDIIAKNSLLVFVNVLGKWVGMIVDAPVGASAAMLGNGVTSHTQYAPDLTVNSQSTHGITNTIAVNAASGDAVVASNTQGGNAVSGQATALANVANVSGSQFGVSDWFGILFINVYQNWYGDFGQNTHYGDVVEEIINEQTPAPTGPIQFIPADSNNRQNTVQLRLYDSRVTQAESASTQSSSRQAVLASTSSVVDESTKTSETKQNNSESYDYRLWIIAGSVFVVGASALGIRRLLQG